MLEGKASWDTRDNPILPTKGVQLFGAAKLASHALGSQADFLELSSRSSAIYPISVIEQFSLAASLSGAYIWSFGNTEQVPLTQRLYLGGRNSVRGFRENSLGPRSRGQCYRR